MSKLDMIGKKFGELTVLERDYTSKNEKRLWWVCKCGCGNIKTISGKILRNGECKTCGCRVKRKGDRNNNWRGYKEISSVYWERILKHARNRNIKVDITIEQAWEQFEKQNRKCALTGLNLTHQGGKDRRKETWDASLDRIDSRDGYRIDNIQWVHKAINKMKMNLPEEDFFKFCLLITKKQLNSRTCLT